ncbi:MAG: hypothetical protein ACJ72X_00770 [Nitrososphaeraceae archaeon]
MATVFTTAELLDPSPYGYAKIVELIPWLIKHCCVALVATAYRNDLTPLMDEQETSHYAIHVLRATTREDFESKIGRLEYSIGKYERLIRATIPISFLIGKMKRLCHL